MTENGNQVNQVDQLIKPRSWTYCVGNFLAKLPKFIVTNFWWIIVASGGIKIAAYFIAPPGNATAGYHFGKLLVGFIGYGGILSIVAFVFALLIKNKPHLFKLLFASLFLLACLFDIPVSLLRREANEVAAKIIRQENEAAAKAIEKYACFEALMKYEDNPTFDRKSYYNRNDIHWKTRVEFLSSVRGKFPEYKTTPDAELYEKIVDKYPVYVEQIEENCIWKKTVYNDGEKYFALSYCYATGYDGYPRDAGKAVQLCQKAASENHWRARDILTKAGISWTY